jgi:hypothetical protein
LLIFRGKLFFTFIFMFPSKNKRITVHKGEGARRVHDPLERGPRESGVTGGQQVGRNVGAHLEHPRCRIHVHEEEEGGVVHGHQEVGRVPVWEEFGKLARLKLNFWEKKLCPDKM